MVEKDERGGFASGASEERKKGEEQRKPEAAQRGLGFPLFAKAASNTGTDATQLVRENTILMCS